MLDFPAVFDYRSVGSVGINVFDELIFLINHPSS
jgi:putative lipoic acid-binding regulatory protein